MSRNSLFDHVSRPLGLVVAVLLCTTAIPSAQAQSELIHEGESPGMFLMYTGDVIGYIDTCGCKKNPAGGLARRKWVIDQLRDRYSESPMLLVDSGNFSDNPTPQGDVKTRALLAGMAELGYQAVNVGERDVKMGYDYFIERTEGSSLPFLSANIVRADTEEPVFEPHVVIDVPSTDGEQSVKVGVIGVARFNPIFMKAGPDGSNLKIVHPNEAVRKQIALLEAENVDLVVLLAALHKDDARRIAREVPGIDFIAGSYGGDYTTQKEREGETWLLYSGNQGKRLGETRVYFGQDHSVAEQYTVMHFLTQVYPADPEMQEWVIEAPTRNLGAPRSSAGGSAEGPFVGSAACKDCHENEYDQWSGTSHAHAWKTLHDQQPGAGEECTSCHVTGDGAGGFVDASSTPALVDVGCESCHGPGQDHQRANLLAYGKTTVDTCTGCHDIENSPDFDYYSYLPRISHGGRAGR